MSTQLKLRRGTTAQHSTFTGAAGEVTVDTTKKTVVVHDGATPGGVALQKEAFQQTGTGSTVRTVDEKLKERVSVLDFGADKTGTADSSAAVLAADAVGAKVFFPKGSYKYTSSSNPNFTGGVETDNVTLNSSVVTDILAFNYDKTLVGLHHNHLQSTTKPSSSGKIIAPPLSKAAVKGPVDVVAHWYNDFGLQGSAGWTGWYTWEWNHVGTANYDTARHPLLGWYRGDDANVLDWQCYWLREHGVSAVIPTGIIDTTTWATSTNANYWLYQLFNNAKNFAGLRYIPWVQYTGTTSAITASWTHIAYNVLGTYTNTYTVEKGDKSYVCVFLWDGESIRGAFDSYSGATNTIAFLKARATEAQALGYDGICVMARNATDFEAVAAGTLADLEANGVLYYPSTYESTMASTGTYSDAVNNWTVPTTQQIVGVATSKQSQSPHPSGWTCTGSTPDLFKKVLQKAIRGIIKNGLPKIVTVYNVSEWAEGGPGLQPNRRDGFGYLQAVRDCMIGNQVQLPSSGTFTPILRFGGNTTGITYVQRAGRWERIGNQIVYHFNIQLSSKGTATGTASIAGFPYASVAIAGGSPVGSALGINMSGTGKLVPLLGGSKVMDLFYENNGGFAVASDTNFGNSTSISVSIVCPIAGT